LPNQIFEPSWRIDVNKLQDLIGLFQQRYSGRPDTIKPDIIAQEFVPPLFESIGWQNGDTNAFITPRGTRQGLPYFGLELGREVKALVFACGEQTQTSPEVAADVAVGTAYNLEVDWAVVTNFAHTALYHTLQVARGVGDRNPAGPPVVQYVFQDYVRADQPRSLVNTLSPWAFVKGYTDELGEEVARQQQRRWRDALTQLMLKLLKGWQYELLETIPGDEQKINLSINRLFHRLIFMRSVEDRGLDQQHSLQEVVQAPPGQALNVLHQLFTHFRQHFDSELFAPSLVDQMLLDEATLRGRIARFYEPAVVPIRFDFSLIDPDMMGKLYEQHLRWRISRLTRPKEETLIEPRRTIAVSPALRTQGIYYTPTWLVDYVVQHTLREWLKTRRPTTWDDVKVLDLACGSGAFLQWAYEELVVYFKNQWEKEGRKFGYRERREILEKSIFGVDENEGAVQNTQLVLWLRAQPTSDHVEAHELPQLDNNIICGNSILGGPDKPAKEKERLGNYFGTDWQAKRPVIWAERFSGIVARGGFDIIVGNPPYANIESLHRERAEDIPYLCAEYSSARGNFDQAAVFVEQAFRLLREDGLLGMVVPDCLLHSAAGQALRDILTDNLAVYRMADFTGEEIFKGVMVYPRLLFLQRRPSPTVRSVTIRRLEPVPNYQLTKADRSPEVLTAEVTVVDTPHPTGSAPYLWFFRTSRENDLRQKLEKQATPLKQVAGVHQGPNTGAEKVFVLNKIGQSGDLIEVYSRCLNKNYELEAPLLRPFLDRKDAQPYAPRQTSRVCLCPYDTAGRLILPMVMAHDYPQAWKYLNDCRDVLERRRSVKSPEAWYRFSRPTLVRYLEVPAIVVPHTARYGAYCLVSDPRYQVPGRAGCGNVIEFKEPDHELFYLGLLNSKLLNWYLQGMSSPKRGGYYEYTKEIVESLPILNPQDLVGRESWVEKIVGSVREAVRAMGESGGSISGSLSVLQQEIDKLAYWLYDLTPEEVLLVEANHYGYAPRPRLTYPVHWQIISDKAIANGEPVMEGTRTTVRTVVAYSRILPSREELLAALPHLQPGQVDAALIYYRDHKDEIDAFIAANDEVARQYAVGDSGR